MTKTDDPIILLARQAVADQTTKVQAAIKALDDSENATLAILAMMFAKAYQDPILTTAVILPDQTPIQTYAGTGGWGCYGPPSGPLPLNPDDPAGYPTPLVNMWIRDACAQYHAYLGIFRDNHVRNDKINALGQVIEGIVRACSTYLTQFQQCSGASCCTPFPNWDPTVPDTVTRHAFNWNGVVPSAGCDYEPDSLAYLIFLATDYAAASGSTTHYDDVFWKAMSAIVYAVQFFAVPLGENGDNTILTKTPNRPSDDKCERLFNIPVNAFLCAMLQRLAVLAANYQKFDIEKAAANLASGLQKGVYLHGTTENDAGAQIYAYETNAGVLLAVPLKMDDANIPSILSLPYLTFGQPTDTLYQTTRNAFLFTTQNSNFIKGTDVKSNVYFEGIGSTHTPPGNIWPMAIVMRGLTADALPSPSDQEKERLTALMMLMQACNTTYTCTGAPGCDQSDPFPLYPAEWYQHESFSATDISQITRGWFAWANALFGEWIDKMVRDNNLPPIHLESIAKSSDKTTSR